MNPVTRKLYFGMCLALLPVFLLFASGCNQLRQEQIKLRDLEFTVLSEEVIPEELKSLIGEKQQEPFKFTYSDQDNLYICVGYGEQISGGYSIAVNELYLTDSAIYVSTELLGPDISEKKNASPSYPYVVIKTEYLEQTVIFE